MFNSHGKTLLGPTKVKRYAGMLLKDASSYQNYLLSMPPVSLKLIILTLYSAAILKIDTVIKR